MPGVGRSPGEGNGYSLQYSDLENSMDCKVHGVTKSQTYMTEQLSLHFTNLVTLFFKSLWISVFYVKTVYQPATLFSIHFQPGTCSLGRLDSVLNKHHPLPPIFSCVAPSSWNVPLVSLTPKIHITFKGSFLFLFKFVLFQSSLLFLFKLFLFSLHQIYHNWPVNSHRRPCATFCGISNILLVPD